MSRLGKVSQKRLIRMLKMAMESDFILFESTLKLRSCLSVRKDGGTQRASRQDAKEKVSQVVLWRRLRKKLQP